jgi:circadian clock protein KaiC
MNTIEKLPTGVPGLDILLRGGIPKGRATLVAGRSGTCKSILALQMACAMAHAGTPVVVLCVEESPEDLVTSAASLGFRPEDAIAGGKLRLVDLTRPLEGPTLVSGEYDLAGLIHRVEGLLRETGAQVLVLDSVTALFSPRPPAESMRSHVYQLLYALRKLGATAVVTAEAEQDYGPLTTLGVEDFVCDLVVVMRNVVDGERRRRSVEVHKYRRSSHFKGEYPCTITHRGLTVFPLDTRVGETRATAERLPSGLEGLDRMTNGGWLRDSIVLVRGPSGSGKTTLAGMYARAGAMRGERVVYYGFEETKPILMRNFASVGLDLYPLEESGNLRIQCRYPEATSPEDLLVDLRTGLDEFRPSLIVLDSISSIEHSTSARGFRQFMIGAAALFREHSRSALITQTASANSESDLGAPYLSTIADAILILDYSANAPTLERTIRVLKMRGSNHATQQHRLEIVQGGLAVEPLGAAR